jgi:secondary thiamine-phosphate synthase enzyme
MPVETFDFHLSTRGNGHVLDVTGEVQGLVERSGVREGSATVFTPGSTAGVTTIEFEPGLVEDMAVAFDRLAPRDIPYSHDARWGDGNGFSHVRAALLRASLTVPFAGGKLLLGTWQQIVVIDFDNRPRDRRVLVQVMGE